MFEIIFKNHRIEIDHGLNGLDGFSLISKKVFKKSVFNQPNPSNPWSIEI